MTLYLYSEGSLDLGDEEVFTPGSVAGPLRPIIEKILVKEGLVIEARPLSRIHGRPGEEPAVRGYCRKVERALRDAERDNAEAVAVVVDRDGPKGAGRLEQMKAGRAAAAVTTPAALGVAQEMVESWLLGDRAAFQRAFEEVPEDLPARPELDTGARGSPHYAKAWLQRLLKPLRARGETFAAAYTRLAEALDTHALEERCPLSFAPFAEEVRANLGPAFRAYL